METIKTNYESVNTNTESVKNITNEYKNKVNDTLNTKVTEELAELFWLNKEQINKLTQFETTQLADSNEVNNVEAQLAKMFWKYDDMMELNKRPISLASAMEEMEKVAA